MRFEFCPRCGDKIVDGQKFCTNCGYNLFKEQQDYSEEAKSIQQPETELAPQPGPAEESQSQPGQEIEKKEPSINVDVPAPLPINESNGLTDSLVRDYKENRVIQYKRLMGMNTDVQNTVVATKLPAMFSDSVFPEVKASGCILSFEDKGLILIGINKLGQFNGQNAFLPNDQIQTVNVNSIAINKSLVFTTFSGKSTQFTINFGLLGVSYQRQNYNNLENLVSKYNK